VTEQRPQFFAARAHHFLHCTFAYFQAIQSFERIGELRRLVRAESELDERRLTGLASHGRVQRFAAVQDIQPRGFRRVLAGPAECGAVQRRAGRAFEHRQGIFFVSRRERRPNLLVSSHPKSLDLKTFRNRSLNQIPFLGIGGWISYNPKTTAPQFYILSR
jgi:hypothetical protein